MLTLFSQEWGRVDALAKGCRKPSSSLLSSSDVFCCSEFSFQIKDGRYYITQAVSKVNFFELRKDMNALITATLLIEVTEKCILPEQSNPRLFALLAGSLYALSQKKAPKKVLLFFIYKLLDILGLRPELDSCAVCGAPSSSYINIAAGGTVCKNCPGEPLEKRYIQAIRDILSTPSRELSKVELPIDQVFYDISIRWLKSALESDLKTLALL
jgi:DNA repair protein RecO (recombination protein O)